MTIILWLLIIAAFMLAFVGLIKPIIPSVLVLWVGFIIYQFGFHNQHLSWVFYVSMALLTILILCADFLANKYFVNRFGGSKFGEYAALIVWLLDVLFYRHLELLLYLLFWYS